MITLWALTGNSQKISQQTSTSILGGLFGRRFLFGFDRMSSRQPSYSNYDRNRQNNNWLNWRSIHADTEEEDDNYHKSVSCSIQTGVEDGRYTATATAELKKDSEGIYFIRNKVTGYAQLKLFHSLDGTKNNGSYSTEVIPLSCDTGWKKLGKNISSNEIIRKGHFITGSTFSREDVFNAGHSFIPPSYNGISGIIVPCNKLSQNKDEYIGKSFGLIGYFSETLDGHEDDHENDERQLRVGLGFGQANNRLLPIDQSKSIVHSSSDKDYYQTIYSSSQHCEKTLSLDKKDPNAYKKSDYYNFFYKE